MNIEDKDIIKVNQIIRKYKKYDHEINNIQIELLKLETRKTEILGDLINLKKEEDILIKKLKDKYGDDLLTPSNILNEIKSRGL